MEKIFEQIDNLFVNGVINGIISIVIAGIVLIAINKLLNIYFRSFSGTYALSGATEVYAGRIILFAFTSSSMRCALQPEILAAANTGV